MLNVMKILSQKRNTNDIVLPSNTVKMKHIALYPA
jgi:hypothetical protein